jgi:hypothetical protein
VYNVTGVPGFIPVLSVEVQVVSIPALAPDEDVFEIEPL